MNATPFSKRRASRGFTLIEVLVVLGIIGMFMIVSYPSVMNTLAVRNLDNAARQIQTFLQQTKLKAVDTKINHRVRFFRPTGTYWAYEMERYEADGTWVPVATAPRKTISEAFVVTVTFPIVDSDHAASFSPMGTFPAEVIMTPSVTFPAFNPAQNSITLQSPKLDRPDQMDERVLSIFMGGSIQYAKRKSA